MKPFGRSAILLLLLAIRFNDVSEAGSSTRGKQLERADSSTSSVGSSKPRPMIDLNEPPPDDGGMDDAEEVTSVPKKENDLKMEKGETSKNPKRKRTENDLIDESESDTESTTDGRRRKKSRKVDLHLNVVKSDKRLLETPRNDLELIGFHGTCYDNIQESPKDMERAIRKNLQNTRLQLANSYELAKEHGSRCLTDLRKKGANPHAPRTKIVCSVFMPKTKLRSEPKKELFTDMFLEKPLVFKRSYRKLLQQINDIDWVLIPDYYVTKKRQTSWSSHLVYNKYYGMLEKQCYVLFSSSNQKFEANINDSGFDNWGNVLQKQTMSGGYLPPIRKRMDNEITVASWVQSLSSGAGSSKTVDPKGMGVVNIKN